MQHGISSQNTPFERLSLQQGMGNPGIGESGNRGIRELGNPGIGESGNPGIGESTLFSVQLMFVYPIRQ